MPQIVETTVPVRQLSVGDIVQFDGISVTEKVLEIDAKVKWAVVATNLGRKRLEVEDTVTVFRVEDTEEEAAAKRRKYTVTALEQGVRDADRTVEAAKTKLLENLDVQDGYHSRYYEGYIAAQEEQRIWARIAKGTEYFVSEGKGDIVDVALLVIEELRNKIVEDAERGASHSTSQMSNVVEMIQRGARATWLRNVRWMGL